MQTESKTAHNENRVQDAVMLRISQVIDHKAEAFSYAFWGTVRHPVYALQSSTVGYLWLR